VKSVRWSSLILYSFIRQSTFRNYFYGQQHCTTHVQIGSALQKYCVAQIRCSIILKNTCLASGELDIFLLVPSIHQISCNWFVWLDYIHPVLLLLCVSATGWW
jgi:hypothetical protein